MNPNTLSNSTIKIVSGEGENGTAEVWPGWSVSGLRHRLAVERCGGDRWARAEVWRSGELTNDDAEAVIVRSVLLRAG